MVKKLSNAEPQNSINARLGRKNRRERRPQNRKSLCDKCDVDKVFLQSNTFFPFFGMEFFEN